VPNFSQLKEFPNLFRSLARSEDGEKDLKKLIGENLLERCRKLRFLPIQDLKNYGLPRVDNVDYIFVHIQQALQKVINIWQEKNNNMHVEQRIFISGDIIPSLLGKIYSDLLHAIVIKPNNNAKVSNLNSKLDIKQHLKNMTTNQKDQIVPTSFILNGDLNINIQLAPCDEGLKLLLLDTIKKIKFPNCNIVCEITDNIDNLKNSASHDKIALDMLYLEITDNGNAPRLTQPTNINFDILHDFFEGEYRFIHGDNTTVPQFIKSLRPLLQLPFLNLKDSDSVRNKINSLHLKRLDPASLKEIEQLTINAYPCAANNRAYREPYGLLNKFADYEHIKKFINNCPITANRNFGSNNNLIDSIVKKMLVTHTKFLNICCYKDSNGKYILFHGVGPDPQNLIEIMAKGPLYSIDGKQGRATYGSGFYVTQSIQIADLFTQSKSFILNTIFPEYFGFPNDANRLILELNDSRYSRFAAYTRITKKEFFTLRDEAEKEGYDDVNAFLFNRYNIDAVIPYYVFDQIVVQNMDFFANIKFNRNLSNSSVYSIRNLAAVELFLLYESLFLGSPCLKLDYLSYLGNAVGLLSLAYKLWVIPKLYHHANNLVKYSKPTLAELSCYLYILLQISFLFDISRFRASDNILRFSEVYLKIFDSMTEFLGLPIKLANDDSPVVNSPLFFNYGKTFASKVTEKLKPLLLYGYKNMPNSIATFNNSVARVPAVIRSRHTL